MSFETFIVNENGKKNKGGRIICGVCGWQGGVKYSKNNRGNDIYKWTARKTCPKCKSTEKVSRMTGEVLQQTLNKGKQNAAL